MIESGCCFNLGLIDTEKLANFLGESNFDELANRLNQTTNIAFEESNYDETVKNNKFNSFPMRKKNSTNSKITRQSHHSIAKSTDHNAVTISEDELNLNIHLSINRQQESNRLKNLLRNNFWPINHPIRKYLWKCLLLRSNVNSNKENSASNSLLKDTNLSEFEYDKLLNQIFGKSKSSK